MRSKVDDSYRPKHYLGVYYTFCDDVGINEGGYYIEFYSDPEYEDRIDWMVLHKNTDEILNPDKYIKEHIINEKLDKFVYNKKLLHIKENVDKLYSCLLRYNYNSPELMNKIDELKQSKVITNENTLEEIRNKLDLFVEKLWNELEDVPFKEINRC